MSEWRNNGDLAVADVLCEPPGRSDGGINPSCNEPRADDRGRRKINFIARLARQNMMVSRNVEYEGNRPCIVIQV